MKLENLRFSLRLAKMVHVFATNSFHRPLQEVQHSRLSLLKTLKVWFVFDLDCRIKC